MPNIIVVGDFWKSAREPWEGGTADKDRTLVSPLSQDYFNNSMKDHEEHIVGDQLP